MGVARTAQTLTKLNQVDGFDCQGCAWPDPDPDTGTPRSSARTAPRRSPRRPPATGSTGLLRRSTRSTTSRERTDYWLGHQGRITEPMVLRAGGTHYEPIEWDAAFSMIDAGEMTGGEQGESTKRKVEPEQPG